MKAAIVGFIFFAACMAVAFAIQAARIEKLQNDVHDLKCRLVLYEDGSTKFKDAEQTQLCWK